MNIFLIISLILGMGAVLAVLIIGIFSMTRGGDFNKKYGNKLMRARVVLQGFAMLMLALAFYSSQSS